MVYKVDGNPQLDTCDWSMYSNILNEDQSDRFRDNRGYEITTQQTTAT